MLKKALKTLTNKEEKDQIQKEYRRAANRSFVIETYDKVHVSDLSVGWSPIPAVLKGYGEMRIHRELGNVLILEYRTAEGFYMDLHTHIKEGYEFEILTTNSGQVIVEVDDYEIKVGQGDIEIIDAQHPHAARVKPQSRGYIVYTKKQPNG